MPNAIVSAFAFAILLAGCTDREDGQSSRGQSFGLAAQMDMPAEAGRDNRQYLERSHAVTIDVPEARIEPAFQAIVAACNTDHESGCTLLNSELAKSEYTTAAITARLAPSGVEPFIAVAAKHGAVESRSTHANDLARPIIDAEQRLKMLETYMGDLLRLQQQSRREVDALIKVASEIAKTQSEIESLKGEYAQLRQRVDFQVVSLHLYSHRTQSFATPIARAFREFGHDLSNGVAQAISGFAYLVPWLLILLPLAFFFRYLWKRFR